MKFHQNDADKSAFLDADLHRLEFGYNKAFGEEKAARYKAELKRFADQHANHEISTRAIANLADVVHGEGDWVLARKIALTGVERNRESIGGKRCHNLIQQIEASESQITTERVWNEPLPTINVSYRNLTKVYFRVVSFDFEEYARSQRWGAENLDQNQRKNLLKQDPIQAWSKDLPATEDYQQRTEELPAPNDLKPGSYFLIASHNEQFTGDDNQISFTEFWVSDLALVIRTKQGEGVLEGFVLNAITGDPLSGAEVRAWQRDNKNQLISIPAVKTDENGLFRFSGQNRNSVLLHAAHGGHGLSTVNYFYVNQYDTKPRPHEQTIFFTDRALYRPGQTIHFKGICVAVDQNQNNYSIIKGRNVTVLFTDANGKEIERLTLRTNDFGSFSGSVTAPRDRLMGQMALRVENGPQGATNFNIEEYKRPKFQVELNPPKEAPRLDDEVKLTGKATAYTGAAIDGAVVRWRVVRQVHYPIWWYWRCWWWPPYPAESREIAHGSSTTNANGTFDLAFTAKPDLSVPKESEPTFHFTVYADVIDTTGETRSAERIVRVGYTALKAALTADDWQTDEKPVEITIKTTTLDDEGQAASGTVKIHTLKQPDKVQRPDLPGYRPYVNPNRGKTIPAMMYQWIPRIPTPGPWMKWSTKPNSKPTPAER